MAAPGTTAAAAAPRTNRIGLTVRRLPRRQDHPLRRLRPQRHLRADPRGLLRPGHRRRSGSPSSPASAARSKSPAYFMSRSHGFNAVHGRMPSVATGALLANRTLLGARRLGDGDTASIGIGQFVHLMRRNLPMVYVVENNGVYGLTKGQFSATADLGSTLKTGAVNDLPAIDTCALAIQLGRHLRGPLLLRRQEAALRHAQGGDRPPGHGLARRHQPLRHLQRPRGLDQELRLHEGARRAAPRDLLRARASRRSRWTTTRARPWTCGCTTARACGSGSWRPATTRRAGSRAVARLMESGPGGDGAHRRPLRRPERARLPHPARHGRRAAGHAARPTLCGRRAPCSTR